VLYQPVAARHAATHWLASTVLLAGAFLPPVDFFIVNVTLPSIHLSLGASPAELQLVIGAYAAGYAVFLITGGRLGDLVGAAMVSAVLGCLIVPLLKAAIRAGRFGCFRCWQPCLS
jgi:MFS family permease